jgi:hypothetical protein
MQSFAIAGTRLPAAAPFILHCNKSVIYPARAEWRVGMNIGIDDAVSMYARACRAWYGSRAAKVARAEIQKLRKRGDWSGVVVWTKLAKELERGPRVRGTAEHQNSACRRMAPTETGPRSRL